MKNRKNMNQFLDWGQQRLYSMHELSTTSKQLFSMKYSIQLHAAGEALNTCRFLCGHETLVPESKNQSTAVFALNGTLKTKIVCWQIFYLNITASRALSWSWQETHQHSVTLKSMHTEQPNHKLQTQDSITTVIVWWGFSVLLLLFLFSTFFKIPSKKLNKISLTI